MHVVASPRHITGIVASPAATCNLGHPPKSYVPGLLRSDTTNAQRNLQWGQVDPTGKPRVYAEFTNASVEKLAQAVSAISLLKDASEPLLVGDIGSGSGATLVHFAAALEQHLANPLGSIWGIEICPERVQLANLELPRLRALYGLSNTTVCYETGDAAKLTQLPQGMAILFLYDQVLVLNGCIEFLCAFTRT